MDFITAFNWLVISWVWKELNKLGVGLNIIDRLKNLYTKSIKIIVDNNKLRQVFRDSRGSLRQGGIASMEWFAFRINPFLRFLEKRFFVSSFTKRKPEPL